MSCEHQERLLDLLYGEVGGDEAARLEREVLQCPTCAEQWRSLQGARRWAAMLPLEEAPRAPLEAALRAAEARSAAGRGAGRLRAHRPSGPWWRRWWRPSFAWALTGSLTAALALVYVLGGPGRRPDEGLPSSRPYAPDVTWSPAGAESSSEPAPEATQGPDSTSPVPRDPFPPRSTSGGEGALGGAGGRIQEPVRPPRKRRRARRAPSSSGIRSRSAARGRERGSAPKLGIDALGDRVWGEVARSRASSSDVRSGVSEGARAAPTTVRAPRPASPPPPVATMERRAAPSRAAPRHEGALAEARSLRASGRCVEAISRYRTWRAAHPGHPNWFDASLEQVDCALRLGRIDQAKRLLLELKRRHPHQRARLAPWFERVEAARTRRDRSSSPSGTE